MTNKSKHPVSRLVAIVYLLCILAIIGIAICSAGGSL